MNINLEFFLSSMFIFVGQIFCFIVWITKLKNQVDNNTHEISMLFDEIKEIERIGNKKLNSIEKEIKLISNHIVEIATVLKFREKDRSDHNG